MYELVSVRESEKSKILRRMYNYVKAAMPASHKRMPWTKVAAEIKDVTGYSYPYDSLRQNIDTQNQAESLPPREIKKDERWQVLKAFLIEVGEILELPEDSKEPMGVGPVAVRDFLLGAQGNSGERLLQQLDGVFEEPVGGHDSDESITLEISYASGKGYARIDCLVEYQGSLAGFKEEEQYYGWCVASMNFAVMLVRHSGSSPPRCYTLLQSRFEKPDELEIADIALQRYCGVLSGTLKKTTTALGPGDDERSVEAFKISNIELDTESPQVPIFLTRRGKTIMEEDDGQSGPKKRRFFAPSVGTEQRKNKKMTRPKSKKAARWDFDNPDFNFIMVLRSGDHEEALRLLPGVRDINVTDRMRKVTALHLAALLDSTELLRELEKREDLNYCVWDYEGNLPADLAAMNYHWKLSRELGDKELEYARKHGIENYPAGPPLEPNVYIMPASKLDPT